MKLSTGRFVVGSLVVILAAALLLSGVSSARPAVYAQASEGNVPARTITVVGEGKVRLKPDVARANIGVEVMGASVQEASAENKIVIEEVLAALKGEGIAESDIQTSGFSIYAERYGPEGPLPPDQTQYRVNNNVSVKIRDLNRVGEILDVAITAGANNIYGVEFGLDDPGVAESEARQKAVEDAQAKAAELAELNGVGVGVVLSISEVIGTGGGYYAGNFAEMARMGMGGGGGTPLEPGELELVMSLQITYEMVD